MIELLSCTHNTNNDGVSIQSVQMYITCTEAVGFRMSDSRRIDLMYEPLYTCTRLWYFRNII
jgi:hypothetical protein